MRQISLLVVFVLLCTAAAYAAPPRITGKSGATLDSLAQSGDLVTLAIKNSDARDPNLQIVEVGDDYLSVIDQDGQRHTYLFSSLASVIVQEGQEDVRVWRPAQGRGLLPVQQQVVTRAMERANQIFTASATNQTGRLDAAAMLAVAGDVIDRDAAIQYIERVHNSNDLESSINAAFQLYLIGREDVIRASVVDDALSRGSREVRTQAAQLAGLIRFREGEVKLLKMLRDRRPDVAAAALLALARMNNRDAVTEALGMLTERNDQKGEAAIQVLTLMATENTKLELGRMLETADGMTRYRIATLLNKLGNNPHELVLRDEIMNVPTLQVSAAITLAKQSDVRAMRLLRERLMRRYDEVENVLLQRAEMAVALIHGGDRTILSLLQDMLRTSSPRVQIHICQQILALADRSILPIVEPLLASPNQPVAISASQTAIAMAYPDFGERLIEINK